MAGASGNLGLVSNHLESPFLIFQMLHDDAQVLCHRSHLAVKALLQFPFLLLRHGGSPAQLRPNDPVLIIVLGGIPHYHVLPFGIWDDLVVNGVWDFEGFLMIFQGGDHKGGEVRSDVGI